MQNTDGNTILPPGDVQRSQKVHRAAFANIVLPTLGGMQFWGDVQFFHQWRIQRNVFTGHYRLLDERNFRHAWGTLERCQAKLAGIKSARSLPPMQGRAVIVLHGLIRTRSSMNSLCRFLRTHGGYSVFNVNYPSTRAELSAPAQDLASIVAHLEGVDEIHMVSHSLGSLVIRHYLAQQASLGDADPRLKRIVMLAPPNNGAELAEKLGCNPVFKSLFGPAGYQLAKCWSDLKKQLAIPSCEFGIIAGGRGNPRGYNPLLSGDDDLVVSVDTTRLPGARDFTVLPVVHTYMMNNRELQQSVLRFFQHGFFVSEAERNPIPAM